MYRLNFYLVGLALLNSASVNAFLPSNMPLATSRVTNLARFSTMDVEQERVEYVVRPNTELPEDAAQVIEEQAKNYKNYFVMGDAEGLTERDFEDGYQPMIPENHPFAWARLLGAVHNVRDVEASQKFYTETLKMSTLRERVTDSSKQKWVGFGSEEYGQHIGIQLSQKASTNRGDGYLGITVVHPDIAAVCQRATANGGKVTMQPTEIEYPATQVPDQDSQASNKEFKAEIEDPDGYKISLIQGWNVNDPIQSIILRVHDMEKAEAYFTQMGMKVLKKRANLPSEASMSTHMGYDDDYVYQMSFVHEKLHDYEHYAFKVSDAKIELRYLYDSPPVNHGDGLANILVGVSDVDAATTHISSNGGKVVQPATTSETVGSTYSVVNDVDGYNICLTNMDDFNKELFN